MLIETLASQFRKALASDASDTSFPALAPALWGASGPTGNGVIDLSENGSVTQNAILAVLYGTAGNGDTFSVRFTGWRKVGTDPLTAMAIPVTLAELACTVGPTTGVSGGIVPETQLFVDTIALTIGNDDVSIDIVSPADNTIAHATMLLKGFQKIQVTFDSTAAGATAMNALVALL